MFRTKSSFLTLFVIFGVGLLMTSLAFGGETTQPGDTDWLAAELGSAGQDWKVPVGSTVVREMAFVAGGNDFIFDLVLGNGATWLDATPTVTISVTQGGIGSNYTAITGLSQTLVTTAITDDTIRIVWDSGANTITAFASATLGIDNLSFDDGSNQAGNEGTISVGVFTFDAFVTTQALDPGANTVSDFFAGDDAIDDVGVTSSEATIDVETDRVNFVVEAGVATLLTDIGAKVDLNFSANAANLYDHLGAIFDEDVYLTLVEGIFSDGLSLDGIASFAAANWVSGAPDRITATVASFGGVTYDTSSHEITITVDGVSSLTSRDIRVAFTATVAAPGGATEFNRGTSILVSDWDLNGCVLIAHWVQGNTDAPDGSTTAGIFKSRMYIVNHTNTVGVVTVDVRESGRSDGGGTAQILGTGSTLPGEIPDLTGAATGGSLVIRLEDVLDLVGVALPYAPPGQGGNLAAVVTVRVAECSGVSQTFHEDISTSFFGTANMTRVE